MASETKITRTEMRLDMSVWFHDGVESVRKRYIKKQVILQDSAGQKRVEYWEERREALYLLAFS